jgi:hypothetical protein
VEGFQSTEGKGMEMEFTIKRNGKTLFKLGSLPESKPMTEEERKATREKSREIQRKRWEEDFQAFYAGAPSSKEGRDRYFSMISWYEMPFFLIFRVWDFLMGRKFWYSKNGLRHEIE